MENFFIGLVFLFLNFNITVSNHAIGLIPTFVGYIFIKRGVAEFEGKVPHFEKLKLFSKIMIAVGIVVYIMDFLAITIGGVYFIVNTAMLAANVYASFCVTEGILYLEETKAVNLLGKETRRMWKVMVIAAAVKLVTVFVPFLNVIATLASFVCTILFLVAFNKTRSESENHYLY